MKIKTENLSGQALNWAVAISLGAEVRDEEDGYGLYCYFDESDYCLGHMPLYNFTPSSNWEQGGEIISREIEVLTKQSDENIASLQNSNPEFKFTAETWVNGEYFCNFGPAALIAAMRCVVNSHLGEEIEIPDELGA